MKKPYDTYLKHVYEIVKHEAKDMDAIYEDYICYLVGVAGLTELRSNDLLESCGVVNGRQLYALCNKN